MKNILILGAVLIAGATVFLFAFPSDTGDTGDTTDTNNDGVVTVNNETLADVQEYFNEKLREGVLDRVGQPIEGFIPQMFMQAFSGIVPKDFDGADAQLGSYTITDKELVFIVDDVDPIHSAADVLTEEGMKTLLTNIEKRANVTVNTMEDIDGLLLFLGAPAGSKVTECLPEQRDVDACIEIYQPVCASVRVECITTPCDPVEETYGNSCKACSNSRVTTYAEGECLGG